MAEDNVSALTRTDAQLVPIKARLPIGKSNLLMDLQKNKKNPIFRISVDILQNTNFFIAFTASANVPSIYIQQFWNTLGKDSKTGVYSFQLDELWFDLNADLLRKALGITPKDSAHYKGGVDEVYGMPIPKDLLTDSIRNSEYYKKYLEMVARKPRQPTTMTGEEVEKKKKTPKADKFTQPAPAKQPKPAKKEKLQAYSFKENPQGKKL
ncbi:hypothetical protein Tco_1235264 [Tanacetum coccineum]